MQPPEQPAPPDPANTRPQRTRTIPGYLRGNYVENNLKRARLYAVVEGVTEPQSVEEALAGPQREEWLLAMQEELASLHEHGTWELMDLPRGAKAIPVKWVFKLKKTINGTIERFKARLVAKGFMQREGIDYNEVFAPTSKHATLRTLMAVVAHNDMELHHLDVKTAFLNGKLEEEIYMQQPPGFEEGSKVCKLLKTLYGLKQAPRRWYARLKEELELLGFTVSSADPSLFIRRNGDGFAYLLVYVDDILMATPRAKLGQLEDIKKALAAVFSIHDLGDVKLFLGMEIIRDRERRLISISQRRYSEELISQYGLDDAKRASLPMKIRPTKALEEEPLDLDTHPYCSLVGGLLYLSVCTRPDITQAVGALARYMKEPRQLHWNAARTVLRYISDTKELGITFGDKDSGLQGFCDSDYAGDIDTGRSTTGYVFLQNGGAVSWSSRMQTTVAASTVEAEYMAAGSAVKEGLWLRNLMMDFGIQLDCVNIKGDNQGALSLLKNSISSRRSKHIDVLHHFARERVVRGEIKFDYCSTHANIADIFTKPLESAKFEFCKAGMGMGSL